MSLIKEIAKDEIQVKLNISYPFYIWMIEDIKDSMAIYREYYMKFLKSI